VAIHLAFAEKVQLGI